MSAPPKTELAASAAEVALIRQAVRTADPSTLGPGRALADPSHVPALLELLSDPQVSGPIYDLPRPIDADNIAKWVFLAQQERERGTGVLFLNFDAAGALAGYSKITVWPEKSSAELAGALRADRQNSGSGGTGAARTIDWIFQSLQVRLVCLTAATDNIRSARLIDHMGFERMGERESVRPDGSVRNSLYWEMTRAAWSAATKL